MSAQPQFRQDPFTHRWVIVAPDRSERPGAFPNQSRHPNDWADRDPFCEGREHETPGELFAVRAPGSVANGPGWRVRVVPNKFPALDPVSATPADAANSATETKFAPEQNRAGFPALGAHEVIVECPEPLSSLGRMPVEQIGHVLTAYAARLSALADVPEIEYPLLFKNHGPEAGASLPHSHSQLMGLPCVPAEIEKRWQVAHDYRQNNHADLFDRIIEEETRTPAERLIQTTDSFVLLCPYASRFPYEMVIFPRAPQACFHEIDPASILELARMLKRALQSLDDLLDDPSYNFVVQTTPRGYNPEGQRWALEILPRVTRLAGFELGGGIIVNPLAPEAAADRLRQAVGKIAATE